MRALYLTIVLCSAICVNSYAQENARPVNPPVTTEIVVGSRGIANQTVFAKKLNSVPRLGFFAFTYLSTDWETREITDYMMQGNLTFQVAKGLDVIGGYEWNAGRQAIRPALGILYQWGNPDWLVILTPRGYFDDNANAELAGFVEYKPKISKNLRLFSHIQGDYMATIKGGDTAHDRSYLWLRAGLLYKEIAFGAAANIDFYGPTKENINNFGGFIRVDLF